MVEGERKEGVRYDLCSGPESAGRKGDRGSLESEGPSVQSQLYHFQVLHLWTSHFPGPLFPLLKEE